MNASKFYFFFSLLILSAAGTAQVKIKFVNRTERPIDSLIINAVYIGHLDTNAVTEVVSFDKVKFDTGFPIFKIHAWVDNTQITSSKVFAGGFCHTQVTTETEGSYTYYLKYSPSNKYEGATLRADNYPKIFSLKELGQK
jgi:hypothetical protein